MQALLYFRNIHRRFNEEAISVKGNYHKKITRFSGFARGDLWDYNRCRKGKSKVRRMIKVSEHRRYRQLNKRLIEAYLTEPLIFLM